MWTLKNLNDTFCRFLFSFSLCWIKELEDFVASHYSPLCTSLGAVWGGLSVTMSTGHSVSLEVRRDQVPVIYHTNLLISNLIQMCTIIIIMAKPDDQETYMMSFVIYYFGVLASLYFKLCIALERCFFITRPLMDFMRQTRSSVLVCILVWALCVVSVPVAIVLRYFLRVLILILVPAFLFIVCFAATLKALRAASPVSTEEKRRIVGTLVLLQLNYFLMILPAITELTFEFHPRDTVRDVVFTLFLLSPFLDLILFFLMQKMPTDKLLLCLCCCRRCSSRASV